MVDIVTGGAGFIGSHLVDRLLADGKKVRVIDIKGDYLNLTQHQENPNLSCHRLDIGREFMEDLFADVETVYHLAALADIVPSIQDPEKYFRTNVNGTMKILEACRKSNVKRIVYAASSSCYGDHPFCPTAEHESINTRYPYALTKRMGEELIMHWSRVYDIPAVSLRLFNVYGPRSRTSGAYGAVFGVFLAQLLAGKPLTVVGDGTQRRDFVYVSDVVNAFIIAAQEKTPKGFYNIGASRPVEINHIVRLLNPVGVVNIPKRPGEPFATHADIEKFWSMTGWEPKVSIEEGIKRLLENIDFWKDAPIWTPESIEVATRDWFTCFEKQYV